MQDPLYRHSIRHKIAFGFVGICLFAFVIGVYFVSKPAQQTLEAEIVKRLEFQAQAYATDLHSSLETLMRRSEDFASDGYVRMQLSEIQAASSAAELEKIRVDLVNHLSSSKLTLESKFVDLNVIDLSGKIVAATGNQQLLSEVVLTDWALSKNSTAISDFYLTEAKQSPVLYLATPILDIHSSTTIGRLLVTVRASSWVSDAMQTDRLGRDRFSEDVSLRLCYSSGSCLLVPATFLNYSYGADTGQAIIEGRGLELIDTQLATTSDVGAERVFSQNFPLGNSGLKAEVLIRSSRAMAPVSGLESDFFLTAFMLTLTALAVLFFPLRFLVRPIGLIHQASQRIRAGDFSARVVVKSDDEIGDLGRSFNLMAAAVEQRTSALEKAAVTLEERQNEIIKQRDRLDHIISTMRDGLVVLDDKGEIILCNKAGGSLRKLLQQNEAISSKVTMPCVGLEQQGDEDGCRSCLFDLFSSERSCMLEVDNTILEVYATPLLLENAGCNGRILVSRDITQRINREKSEVHNERLFVLGEVAATMAHELNNPLASISMFNQMLKTSLPKDSDLHENVDVIGRNAETCKQVISELLNYAASSDPEIGLFDIHDILLDVVKFLRPTAESNAIQIVCNFNAKFTMMRADEVQLRQVFVNLVMNAIQAIESDGTVTLTSADENHHLSITVSDTGCGIPAESRDSIFRAFYTTKSRGMGTGLGLPTALRIAESHGGGIKLVSSSSSGTTFEVRLRPAPEGGEV
ncbi:MAG: ATP-binding protein [Planctomycetota bacterium]|nr:ATP-binding protein [Planctomycetota bacterium]